MRYETEWVDGTVHSNTSLRQSRMLGSEEWLSPFQLLMIRWNWVHVIHISITQGSNDLCASALHPSWKYPPSCGDKTSPTPRRTLDQWCRRSRKNGYYVQKCMGVLISDKHLKRNPQNGADYPNAMLLRCQDWRRDGRKTSKSVRWAPDKWEIATWLEYLRAHKDQGEHQLYVVLR